jgi:hypothetical protein
LNGLTYPERFFYNVVFIFCHVTENEAKENARVPLIPSAPPMTRRGTMGKKKT